MGPFQIELVPGATEHEIGREQFLAVVCGFVEIEVNGKFRPENEVGPACPRGVTEFEIACKIVVARRPVPFGRSGHTAYLEKRTARRVGTDLHSGFLRPVGQNRFATSKQRRSERGPCTSVLVKADAK